jgi:hypothetical protein
VNCTGNDGPFFCVNVSVSRYPCDEDERVVCGVVYPYGFIGGLAGTVWWLYGTHSVWCVLLPHSGSQS